MNLVNLPHHSVTYLEISAEQAGQRVAITSILVFLFIGLILLLRVNEKKALEDATNYAPQAGSEI